MGLGGSKNRIERSEISRQALVYALASERIRDGRAYPGEKGELVSLGRSFLIVKGNRRFRADELVPLLQGNGLGLALYVGEHFLGDESVENYGAELREQGVLDLRGFGQVLIKAGDVEYFRRYASGAAGLFRGWGDLAEEYAANPELGLPKSKSSKDFFNRVVNDLAA